MRIGILGGTFDPPHVGHLILADEAFAQLGLDRLLWVLTPDPPHKQGRRITPLADRLELLQAALADNSVFELSRVDIDRPPPHYSLGTIQELRRIHPQDALIYLIGGDSLHDLPTWHRPHDFLDAIDGLGVMRRPGDAVDLAGLEADLPLLRSKVEWIHAPLLEISGTYIRRLAASGGPFRYYVRPAVYELIQERNLYR